MSGNTSKIISNFNPLRYVAESEAAKVAAVAELRAYAQQIITAGGSISEVNAALETAVQNVWKSKSMAAIATAKQSGMDAVNNDKKRLRSRK